MKHWARNPKNIIFNKSITYLLICRMINLPRKVMFNLVGLNSFGYLYCKDLK